MQQGMFLFLGVVLFGLLHGVIPSHDWIVGVLYSIRKKRQIISSLVSSGVIAGAHFLSSIVVVMALDKKALPPLYSIIEDIRTRNSHSIKYFLISQRRLPPLQLATSQ